MPSQAPQLPATVRNALNLTPVGSPGALTGPSTAGNRAQYSPACHACRAGRVAITFPEKTRSHNPTLASHSPLLPTHRHGP